MTSRKPNKSKINRVSSRTQKKEKILLSSIAEIPDSGNSRSDAMIGHNDKVLAGILCTGENYWKLQNCELAKILLPTIGMGDENNIIKKTKRSVAFANTVTNTGDQFLKGKFKTPKKDKRISWRFQKPTRTFLFICERPRNIFWKKENDEFKDTG